MKIISLTLACAVSALTAFAQVKTPKWVTATPVSNATVKRAVAKGTTLEEARHNAINQLIGQTNLVREDNSYQKRLLDSGREPINQHTALVKAAEQSLFFPTKNQYVSDEGCWVLCEMSIKGLGTFADSLHNAINTVAYTKLQEGRSLQSQGDLYGAAKQFGEALQIVIPMIHKQLTCPEGDLVDLLHDSYVHCMDSIMVKFDLHESPMICGEEVPLDLLVSATYQGKPVSALPLQFMLNPTGALVESVSTDGQGRAKTRIIQAPQAENALLTVTTKLAQMISTLPQNIFSNDLNQQILLEDSHDEMRLNAIDPTPTYYLQPLAEGDESCLKDSLSALMSGIKFLSSEKPDNADVLLSHTFSYEPEGEASTGKYQMQYFVCSLSITATDRRSKKELAKVEKAGLRLFLPSNVSAQKIQSFATDELYYRLRHQMKKLSGISFNKRHVIFGIN